MSLSPPEFNPFAVLPERVLFAEGERWCETTMHLEAGKLLVEGSKDRLAPSVLSLMIPSVGKAFLLRRHPSAYDQGWIYNTLVKGEAEDAASIRALRFRFGALLGRDFQIPFGKIPLKDGTQLAYEHFEKRFYLPTPMADGQKTVTTEMQGEYHLQLSKEGALHAPWKRLFSAAKWVQAYQNIVYHISRPVTHMELVCQCGRVLPVLYDSEIDMGSVAPQAPNDYPYKEAPQYLERLADFLTSTTLHCSPVFDFLRRKVGEGESNSSFLAVSIAMEAIPVPEDVHVLGHRFQYVLDRYGSERLVQKLMVELPRRAITDQGEEVELQHMGHAISVLRNLMVHPDRRALYLNQPYLPPMMRLLLDGVALARVNRLLWLVVRRFAQESLGVVDKQAAAILDYCLTRH